MKQPFFQQGVSLNFEQISYFYIFLIIQLKLNTFFKRLTRKLYHIAIKNRLKIKNILYKIGMSIGRLH